MSGKWFFCIANVLTLLTLFWSLLWFLDQILQNPTSRRLLHFSKQSGIRLYHIVALAACPASATMIWKKQYQIVTSILRHQYCAINIAPFVAQSAVNGSAVRSLDFLMARKIRWTETKPADCMLVVGNLKLLYTVLSIWLIFNQTYLPICLNAVGLQRV